MRIRALSVLALLVGAGILVFAVWTGRAEVGLLVVVPFVVGSGPVTLAGVGLLFVGLTGLFFSLGSRRPTGARRRMAEPMDEDLDPDGGGNGAEGGFEAGGVVMLGPIPIVLGTDRRAALLALLVGVLVLLGVIVVLLMA